MYKEYMVMLEKKGDVVSVTFYSTEQEALDFIRKNKKNGFDIFAINMEIKRVYADGIQDKFVYV
jgi:hypothetical protein